MLGGFICDLGVGLCEQAEGLLPQALGPPPLPLHPNFGAGQGPLRRAKLKGREEAKRGMHKGDGEREGGRVRETANERKRKKGCRLRKKTNLPSRGNLGLASA